MSLHFVNLQKTKLISLINIDSALVCESPCICRVAAPGYPFEYSFMDQQFDNMYRKGSRQQKLLTSFSGLAILIASLGLFGLATFTANKRTKEVGIRKILGSSVSQIVLLLSRVLLKPVVTAAVIAIPLG